MDKKHNTNPCWGCVNNIQMDSVDARYPEIYAHLQTDPTILNFDEYMAKLESLWGGVDKSMCYQHVRWHMKDGRFGSIIERQAFLQNDCARAMAPHGPAFALKLERMAVDAGLATEANLYKVQYLTQYIKEEKQHQKLCRELRRLS